MPPAAEELRIEFKSEFKDVYAKLDEITEKLTKVITNTEHNTEEIKELKTSITKLQECITVVKKDLAILKTKMLIYTGVATFVISTGVSIVLKLLI